MSTPTESTAPSAATSAPIPPAAVQPPAAAAPESSLLWIKVALPGELREGMRKRLPVRGRDVTVFFLKGKYYCLDSVCYRAHLVSSICFFSLLSPLLLSSSMALISLSLYILAR